MDQQIEGQHGSPLRPFVALSAQKRPPPPCRTRRLCAAVAFPALVRGPVDFFHGLQPWINAPCLARRSGVQPLLIYCLQ